MLGKFKMRASTLDQQEMVGQLGDDLQDLVEVYLRQAFPSRSGDRSLVVRALARVWAQYPLSLRVKELFETVETFKQVRVWEEQSVVFTGHQRLTLMVPLFVRRRWSLSFPNSATSKVTTGWITFSTWRVASGCWGSCSLTASPSAR